MSDNKSPIDKLEFDAKRSSKGPQQKKDSVKTQTVASARESKGKTERNK